ncbi:MAG TPA: amidohydrolase family protein [Bryobacteraceae bacterium]|jgi:predicted TIM-barrel fold metal-dependent hydrolase
MNRRTFLATAAVAATAAPAPIPIVDTHIHLFDTTRPGGVPWPPKGDVIYKSSSPARFRELVKGLNVVGAVEIECSPLFNDNQWVLDVMAKDPIMTGMIGDLEPDHPDFPKHLERFHKNPLYLGIRYGNIWNRDFHAKSNDPKFIAGIKLLAQTNLTLDSANPTQQLVADLLKLKDRVPNLRLVMDHLPRLEPAADLAVNKQCDANLRELAKRPGVYVKVSGVLRKVDNKVPTDLAFYKPRLDHIYEIFGPDRVVYGSDWPNSDYNCTYQEGLAVVREYFNAKGRSIAEKYFWRNSIEAYRWIHREPSQPRA